MSTDTERRELIRPDATVAYWASGPEQAPVVVLLHGATLDHLAWAPQAAALAGRYRVIVPDLRGHGESPIAGAFRFGDVVEDIEALLDEVGAGAPVVLGGLSLGGNIAQEVVYRSPDRVDALVVADSTCNTAPRHPLAAPLTVATLSAMALTSPRRFLENAAAVTSAHEDVRRYVVDANAGRSPREVLQILTSLLDDALHPDPDYQLPVPTLLLHGAQDRVGDIAAGTRAWADREPQVEYIVVADAGHASNLDNPEDFTKALDAFLDRVLPPDIDDDQEQRTVAVTPRPDDALPQTPVPEPAAPDPVLEEPAPEEPEPAPEEPAPEDAAQEHAPTENTEPGYALHCATSLDTASDARDGGHPPVVPEAAAGVRTVRHRLANRLGSIRGRLHLWAVRRRRGRA